MIVAGDLLKSRRVGIRDMKEHLSTELLKEVLIVTDRGHPVSANLPYSDVLELVDIIDELTDPETIEAVAEARAAIKKETIGIPVSRLFKEMRKESA